MNTPLQRILRRGLLSLLLVLALSQAAGAAGGTTTIGPERIRQVLNNYLRQQQPRFPGADLRFREIQALPPFTVPAGRLSWEVTPGHPNILSSQRFNVILRIDGQVVKNISLRAVLEALAPVAVARTDLPRGAIIGPDDFDMVTMEIGSLRQPCLDEDALVGKKLRRGMTMGSVFSQAMLEIPPLVKRGEMVTIQARKGPLLLTARGQAQENGRDGDAIRVKNLSSNKEIIATVTAPLAVQVEF